MDRKELLSVRETVYAAYTERVKLGEFDANSNVIQLCLQTLVEILNHELSEMKKDVQQEAKSTAAKIPPGRAGTMAKRSS